MDGRFGRLGRPPHDRPARALGGIPGSAITYIPKSGGGESIQTLLSGTTDFASTGFNEVSDQIEAGRVKAIGIAAPERLAGFEDIPTMSEQGFEVTLTNWRGWLGAPGITADETAELVGMLEATRNSAEWEGRPDTQPVDGRVADWSGVRRLHRRRHQAHRSAP